MRMASALFFVLFTTVVLNQITQQEAVARRREPDFSGTWMIDKSRTVGEAPWGQTYADKWIIKQTGTELTLNVNEDSYTFTLNGVVRSVLDNSLGELVNFIRKTETVAEWSGSKLVLKVTEVSEQTDPKTLRVTIGPGITNVNTLSLSEDGKRLTVERTGYRAKPPAVLHGRPYEQSEDFAYRQEKVVYVKTGQ